MNDAANKSPQDIGTEICELIHNCRQDNLGKFAVSFNYHRDLIAKALTEYGEQVRRERVQLPSELNERCKQIIRENAQLIADMSKGAYQIEGMYDLLFSLCDGVYARIREHVTAQAAQIVLPKRKESDAYYENDYGHYEDAYNDLADEIRRLNPGAVFISEGDGDGK